jgi:hypothetical protein
MLSYTAKTRGSFKNFSSDSTGCHKHRAPSEQNHQPKMCCKTEEGQKPVPMLYTCFKCFSKKASVRLHASFAAASLYRAADVSL